MVPPPDEVVATLQRRVLYVVRWLLIAWTPVLGVLVVRAAHRGRGLYWVACEAAMLLLFLALSFAEASIAQQARALVGMLLVFSTVATTYFGPTMGTGVFLVATMIAAAFFFDRRGVITTFGMLSLMLATVGLLAARGLVEPTSFAPEPTVWLRIVASTVPALGGTTFTFTYVLERLRGAIAAEHEAREREERAHTERERVMLAVETSHRLEALGRLAAGVAHDMNNALVVIRGGIDVLRTTADEGERRSILREVSDGVQRATVTAKQLLAFARHNLEAQGTCTPATALRSVAHLVGPLLPGSITLVLRGDTTATIGLASEAFERVLLNLVINARDALPTGGRIEVACEEANGQVEIRVTDNGAGMTEEVRAHAFEPFYTTKGDHGTGLGLSTAWGLVTKVGGTIAIDSIVGQGTTVRLGFPALAPAPAAAPVPAPVAVPREVSGPVQPKLLVLEDEPDVAKVIVRVLRRAGYAVDLVDCVAEAVLAIEKTRYDLFVTDGRVPDGPITPALEAFRQERTHAPVILCSAYVEEMRGLSAGTTMQVLAKPFAPAELVELVEAGLGRSSPV